MRLAMEAYLDGILADLAPPPYWGARMRLAMGAYLEGILASLQTLQGFIRKLRFF